MVLLASGEEHVSSGRSLSPKVQFFTECHLHKFLMFEVESQC